MSLKPQLKCRKQETFELEIPFILQKYILIIVPLFQSCSSELSRQNNVVRQLKQDNEQLNDQVKLLQDKWV